MVSKDFYALNLSDSQTNKLISKIEQDIAHQLLELQTREEPLRELTEMYSQMKHEVDTLNNELQDNQKLLEALVRFRSNDRSTKELRVLRTTSNLEKKPRQQRYFKWIVMAVEVLIDADHFLTFDELFSRILKANPEIENHFTKTKLKKIKLDTHNNLLRTCRECREKNRGKVIDYNKKFGLFDWVTDDFVPEPKYIKHFMHNHVAVL